MTFRIPMPEWYSFLTPKEQMKCLGILDAGENIKIEIKYNPHGEIESAKLVEGQGIQFWPEETKI